jgi:integrase
MEIGVLTRYCVRIVFVCETDSGDRRRLLASLPALEVARQAESSDRPALAYDDISDAKLEQDSIQFIRQNQNANTRRTYDAAYGLFVKWCAGCSPPRPSDNPTPAMVADYVRHLGQVRKVAMSTIMGHVAAISDACRFKPGIPPTRNELVRQMIQVFKPISKDAKPKRALSLAEIERIAQLAESSAGRRDFLAQRDVLMVLMAVSFFLRASEVARLKASEVQLLVVKGVKVLRVSVNKLAKNDVDRKGHVRVVAETTGEAIKRCPVRLYERYVREWCQHNPEYLFFSDRGGNKLRPSTPNGRLKKLLMSIGLSASMLSECGFHSCRKAGVTMALQSATVDIWQVQRHGNWRSDAVLAYIEEDLQQQLQVGRAVMQATGVPEADSREVPNRGHRS